MKQFLNNISFILLILLCSNSIAQGPSISGVVVDIDNQPLPGVTVLEVGTTNGVITNLEGEYTILISNPESQLEYSFVGMVPQIVSPEGQSEINITLETDVYQVDEVVVTALGISKETKSLGYAVTAVDSEELTEGGNKSMLNALQGKVAGVNISSASGAPGSSTRVMVRGVSSLSGSNQPLYVIDGVSVTNSQTGSSSINGGTDFGNKINDINPNDIESISFLKGASGTALYGSRAASGVIIITTKKGANNQKAKVSYAGSMSFEKPLRLVDYQNEYGQGLHGNSVLYENTSWGPKFDNKYHPWGNSVDGVVRVKSYRALPTNVEEFFETGKSTSHSLSLSGGNDVTTYFFSYSNVKWDGIFPTDSDTYDKNTFALRGSQKLSKNMVLATSINYIRKENSSVPTGQGNSSVYNQVMQTPRDISLLEQQDLTNSFNTVDNYYSLYTVNPYHILYNNGNQNTEDRVYGSLDFDIELPYSLKAKWRLGADISNGTLSAYRAPIVPKGNNENAFIYEPGARALSSSHSQQINSDIILSWFKEVKDFDISLLGGQALNERSGNGFGTSVNSQQLERFYHLSNSTVSPQSYEGLSMVRTVSVYGAADFSYKSFLFLGFTGRNEWSSTLPKQNNSFFFPSVNASFVFTEFLPSAKGFIPFGKIRASWAMVGKGAQPYYVDPTYESAFHSDGYGSFSYPTSTNVNSYNVSSIIKNHDLQPEMTTAYEFGLDLRFFNNRISIDAAYYNRVAENLIWLVPIASSSGYRNQMKNVGKMENYGFEGLLNIVPVRKNKFIWELSFNFTKNFNRLNSLTTNLEKAELNSLRVDGGQQIQWVAAPGQPVGIFEARGPKYTEDGKLIVSNQGLPIADSELKVYGNSQYDFYGGIINSFTVGGFKLSLNFDIRMGGIMYSRTKNISHWAGTAAETQYNDREPFIIPNSVYEVDRDENGDPVYAENTIPIDRVKLVDYWGSGGTQIDGSSFIDKSFIKLRTLSFGYDLPAKMLGRTPFTRLYIGVSGKNLWLWTPDSQRYIDPELTTFGNDLTADFGEYGAQPSVRSWSFNLKVDF